MDGEKLTEGEGKCYHSLPFFIFRADCTAGMGLGQVAGISAGELGLVADMSAGELRLAGSTTGLVVGLTGRSSGWRRWGTGLRLRR